MKKHATFVALLVFINACVFVVHSATRAQEIPVYNCDLSLKFQIPTKFVIFGDSREKMLGEFGKQDVSSETRKNIADMIASTNPAIVVSSGDLCGAASMESSWRDLDQNYKFLRDRDIPIYTVFGNHEYKYDIKRGEQNFFARFKGLNRKKWYSISIGSVAFVMLDSNFHKLTKTEILEQDQWLESELTDLQNSSEIKLISLVCHHTPFTNNVYHPDNKDVQDKFLIPAAKYSKFKVLFVGHVHNYERFYKDGIMVVVSGGGGAPLYALKKDGDHDDVSSWKGERGHNFIESEITENSFKCKVHGLVSGQWEIKDSFEFKLK